MTINYSTTRNYCRCCNQKLPEAETINSREFHITSSDYIEWGGEEWKFVINEGEDVIYEMVDEFVHETISFFATSSDTIVNIEKSEIEKAVQFFKKEVAIALN